MMANHSLRRLVLAVTAVAGVCLACVAAESKSMSLADARAKIGEVIEEPSEMEAVMAALSAEDQRIFLGEVNAAIARMPGSAESRAAALLNVDSAALRAAKPGNLAALLAEVFATSTVEALPILSERFAADLFNRDALQDSKKMSDEQYIQTVRDTMSVVNNRMVEVDAGNVRSAFIALLFIRASNSDSSDFIQTISGMVPEKAREDAVREWIPEALGLDGKEQSYDALFAVANGGVVPEIVRTLEIAGPQFQAVLLSDLTGFNTEPFAKTSERTPITDAIFNPYRLGRPISGNNNTQQDPPVPPPLPPEPDPYGGQSLH